MADTLDVGSCQDTAGRLQTVGDLADTLANDHDPTHNRRQTMNRPNILFITTDQQRWDHVGLLDLPGIETPALDRIGREGACVTRAYCPSPICTPTRASLLSGQYPSVHGAFSIGTSLQIDSGKTLPGRLRAAGYATSLIGKAHFVRRALEAESVSGMADPTDEAFSGPSDYAGFEEAWVSTGHTTNTRPECHYKWFLKEAGVAPSAWFPALRGEALDSTAAGPWDIPPEYHTTGWIGGVADEWIGGQSGERPWFTWVSFEDPHEPFLCPREWYERVDRSQLRPFEGVRPGEFEDKPPVYRDLHFADAETKRERYADAASLPCVFAKPQLDERAIDALQATCGMIGFIDAQVGRLIDRLEAGGQLENTIIVVTSDHGEMHGHHGFWGKGATAYDDCQKVPLLIWAPGFGKRRGVDDALVNLVDLPRTFLAMAGLVDVAGLQGEDLSGYIRGESDVVREATRVECHATAKLYQETLVTDTHKLVIYRDWERGELYDLCADPGQYENLWDREPAVRGDLLLRLARERLRDEPRARPRESFA